MILIGRTCNQSISRANSECLEWGWLDKRKVNVMSTQCHTIAIAQGKLNVFTF